MNTPRHHKLWWQSSYDRGLAILLPLWPRIKEKYPDAELGIAYGVELFETGYRDNPERMNWLQTKILDPMKQEGITHYGRVGQQKLKEIRKQYGIWAYCTYFPEIFCIGAVECQLDGVVPCVIDYAALKETVQSGVKVDGDIFDKETQDKWLEELLKLMGDEKRWKAEQVKGMKHANKYSWDLIANLWIQNLST